MDNSVFKIQNFQRLFCILLFAISISAVKAQSTNIAFPTPVSSHQISGIIPARDVGDPRLTSYYYTFNGSQGDMFINVSTTNFNGDIEVFAAEGLRSLSKITMFADNSANETGRIIYFRKPEKLILRVQGRTPDDNPARFTIKFAGSFVAVQGGGEVEEPKLPEITAQESSGIRVNSVGTIIEVKPKPTPAKTEIVADTERKELPEETPAKTDENNTDVNQSEVAEKTSEENNAAEKAAPEKPTARKPAPRNTRRTTPARTARARTNAAKTPPKAETPKETPPNPLENVHLKVQLKTGEELDFPMTEVFRFSMNNGILVITMKSGKIHRYPIVDTQRIIIE
jgi:hypothetical protein